MTLDKYEKIVDILTRITGTAARAVLFMTMAVVSLSVIMRIVFSSPIAGLTDIVSVFNALAVAFAVSVAERRNKHIRVDFVREYLPEKLGRAIWLLMNTLAIIVLCGIAWRFYLYIATNYIYGSATWIMTIPFWPVVLCIFLGMVVFVMTAILNFLKTLRGWKTGETAKNDVIEDLGVGA